MGYECHRHGYAASREPSYTCFSAAYPSSWHRETNDGGDGGGSASVITRVRGVWGGGGGGVDSGGGGEKCRTTRCDVAWRKQKPTMIIPRICFFFLLPPLQQESYDFQRQGQRDVVGTARDLYLQRRRQREAARVVCSFPTWPVRDSRGGECANCEEREQRRLD